MAGAADNRYVRIVDGGGSAQDGDVRLYRHRAFSPAVSTKGRNDFMIAALNAATVDEVVDRQQHPRLLRSNVAIGEPGEIVSLHAKTLVAKNLGDLPRQNGPLVLGDTDRTIKWRGAVAIEPHERIHPVGVEGDEAPARLEHSANLAREPPWVGKMMHQPAQQRAVQTLVLKRQTFRVALDQFEVGILAAGQAPPIWG